MSDVKAKVIAIVTGVPFVSKETIQLQPDEVVVKKQPTLTGLISAPVIQCESSESGGHQCELEKGHSGRHWISQETIYRSLGRTNPIHVEPNNDATGVSVVDSVETDESKKPFIRFKMLGKYKIIPEGKEEWEDQHPLVTEYLTSFELPRIVLPPVAK